MKSPFLIFTALCAWTLVTAAPVEKVKNGRVVVQDITLQPGETEPAGGGFPSVTLFFSDGVIVKTPADKTATTKVNRGVTVFRDATAARISAAGSTPVRFVRIEFPGAGLDDVWGRTGLSPNYQLLIENRYARVYDIKISAGTSEPLHTHHDRVVVCFSGAKLRHAFPDGHEEDSSIQTDDSLWRKGQTHVGKNIGTTNFWAIAVEPK